MKGGVHVPYHIPSDLGRVCMRKDLSMTLIVIKQIQKQQQRKNKERACMWQGHWRVVWAWASPLPEPGLTAAEASQPDSLLETLGLQLLRPWCSLSAGPAAVPDLSGPG